MVEKAVTRSRSFFFLRIIVLPFFFSHLQYILQALQSWCLLLFAFKLKLSIVSVFHVIIKTQETLSSSQTKSFDNEVLSRNPDYFYPNAKQRSKKRFIEVQNGINKVVGFKQTFDGIRGTQLVFLTEHRFRLFSSLKCL